MSKRVTFVNTNQVKPAIAPIAFDYLSGPVARAGFSLTLLDLCFADDWEAAIAEHAAGGSSRLLGGDAPEHG